MADNKYRRAEDAPYGMQRFSTWFRVGIDAPRGISPTDIDCLFHNKDGNRFLMMEFKPVGHQTSWGQAETLAGFSRKPGCMALLVEDPYSSCRLVDGDPIHEQAQLPVYEYQNGKCYNPRIFYPETLRGFIRDWYNAPSETLL